MTEDDIKIEDIQNNHSSIKNVTDSKYFYSQVKIFLQQNIKFSVDLLQQLKLLLSRVKEKKDILKTLYSNIKAMDSFKVEKYFYENYNFYYDLASEYGDIKKIINYLKIISIVFQSIVIFLSIVTCLLMYYMRKSKAIYYISSAAWCFTSLNILLSSLLLSGLFILGFALLTYRGFENKFVDYSDFKDFNLFTVMPDCLKESNKSQILNEYGYYKNDENKQLLEDWENIFNILFNIKRLEISKNYGEKDFWYLIDDWVDSIINPYTPMNTTYNNIISKKFSILNSYTDYYNDIPYQIINDCANKTLIEFHFMPQLCHYPSIEPYENAYQLTNSGACLLLDQIELETIKTVFNVPFKCTTSFDEKWVELFEIYEYLYNYYDEYHDFRNTVYYNGLEVFLYNYLNNTAKLQTMYFDQINSISSLIEQSFNINFTYLSQSYTINKGAELFDDYGTLIFSILQYTNCSFISDNIFNNYNFMIFDTIPEIYALFVIITFMLVFSIILSISTLVASLNHKKKYKNDDYSDILLSKKNE